MDEAFDALRSEVEAARAPSDLYLRIARRAAEQRGSARAGWRMALIAGVTAVALFTALASWWHLRPQELAGFQLEAASADFRPQLSGDLLTVEVGDAWLRVTELRARVSVSGGTLLRRERQGVRLVRGTADFQVEPRVETPFAVYVSGGRIEVLGTRFAVVQGDAAGEVRLTEGSIRFVDLQGRETLLHPGQRLEWPEAAVEEAPPLPPALPAPDTAAPPPPPATKIRHHPRAPDRPAPARLAPPVPARVQADEAVEAQQRSVLAEIDGLRIRREDDRLVARLDEILAGQVPEPLRERLSFERCDVLAHRAGEERRACEAIGRQLVTYPGGQYAPQLQRLRRSLGCHP
jgi:hypothetical protein